MLRDFRYLVNQEFGSSRRSFHPGMCHRVEHRIVPLVTDTGDDGQRELGTSGRQEVRIKTG